MGRQAYLNKIAFGRSAFEPSQTTTRTPAYIQLASAQHELPAEVRDSISDEPVQLFDERGNPINPRAHEHGRRLREAQNDVLASIGVVERHRPPGDLPGSYRGRLEQMEEENTFGAIVGVESRVTRTACTWWIGSLRNRILTFHFDSALAFSQIAAAERGRAAKAMLYTGFPSALLYNLGVAGSEVLYALRPLDRLFISRSRKTRDTYRRFRHLGAACLHVAVELVLYPLVCHATLQRLGLMSARPLFPPAKSFVPFSRWSPLSPLSARDMAALSVFDLCKAVATSPFVLVCATQLCERWVHDAVRRAMYAAILRPENPDVRGLDDGWGDPTTAFPGTEARLPPFLGAALRRLLCCVGWGKPEKPTAQACEVPLHDVEGQTVEINGTRVADLERLELGFARPHRPSSPTDSSERRGAAPTPEDQLPPSSPTISHTSRDENEPRIRITSRANPVEMEIHLPDPVVSFRAEGGGSDAATSPGRHDASVPARGLADGEQTYHRVTRLSLHPSRTLSAICSAAVATWCTMPLRLVTLRLLSSRYLAGRAGHADHGRVLALTPLLGGVEASSRALQLSRLALCGGIELVADLSLWGLQYWEVTWMGRCGFGWGTL